MAFNILVYLHKGARFLLHARREPVDDYLFAHHISEYSIFLSRARLIFLLPTYDYGVIGQSRYCVSMRY